eukprot:TRINITY_DN1495_c3_g1_i2.p1 TRINITY_DN1495_c3_g1~~TRINITY_DN1495_c3_g1_i2.p1  ORF type:complete len:289 (+),score=53.45 TRINITY_DN1495_c3_g1_i2:67-867(+)
MMNTCDTYHSFLAGVGMTDYTMMLEQAGITSLSEITEVTEEFLIRNVGIDKALHRRKLLKGVERLRNSMSESSVEVISAEKYVPQMVAAVQFKWGRVDYFGTWALPENVLSTHVVVEGEEGYDMGYVISCTPIHPLESPPKFNVVRYATEEEVSAWTTSMADAEAKYCKLLNQIPEVRNVFHINRVVFRFDMRRVTLLVSQARSIPRNVSTMLASYFPTSQMSFSVFDCCDSTSLASVNSSDCLDTLSMPSAQYQPPTSSCASSDV